MIKSTMTLTQSGLLPVLLQRQRYRVIQLARRGARRKRVHAAFGIPSLGYGALSRRERSPAGRDTVESEFFLPTTGAIT